MAEDSLLEISLPWPVKELDLVLQACDPSKPLEPGDPRYADFRGLRHGVGIMQRRRVLLAQPPSGRFHHSCLCGHRGSGKSTELLALKQWADENGFLAVLAQVEEEIGMIQLEFSDLFLLTATVAEQAMQDFGHPLPKDKIRLVIQWFADIVKEDSNEIKSEIAAEATAQLGGNLPLGLGKLAAKLTSGVKAASSHAIKTREVMRNFPNQLIDLTNDLLRTANETLAANGKPRGLLLLFDQMDRYDPEQIDRVLYRGCELMSRLEGHALFTIPIALEFEPRSGPSHDPFGFSVVLPMLALRQKGQRWAETVAQTPYDEAAIAEVRTALARRIDLNLFQHQEDADLLIKVSGGCIRDLMHLLTLAFTYTEEDRLTTEAVRSAIQEMRGHYVRQLNQDDYRYLAAIARRELLPDADNTKVQTEQKSRLLFNRFALEYLDDEHLPWLDVHPIVIEIEEFRHAFNQAGPLA